MANEAVLLWELEPPIPVIVADGTPIEKGALLKMSDHMTAALANGDADIVAGIASKEKIQDDGNTTLGVYRKGIFKMHLSGSCDVGDALETDIADNYVGHLDATISGSRMVGTALETGVDGDTIRVELNIGPPGIA